MFKKRFLIILVFSFLLFANKVDASVVINEVQIGPIGDRFIELYNSDNSPINLTGWYIQRKTEGSETFNSLVTKTNFENKIIDANDYFLISKGGIQDTDIILDNLTLTESNTIQIKNSNGDILDKVSWGSITDGKSTQRVSNDWVIASPTPGKVNSASSSSENNDSESNSENDSEDNDTKEEVKVKPVNKTKILVKNPAFALLPVQFKIDNSLPEDSCGMYQLNFGDGSFIEIKNKSKIDQSFSHTYYYEGEYIVNFECYKSYLSTEPIESSKITMKVVVPTVFISKIGEEKDFFVEISNDTSYEVDISNWSLLSFLHKFIFPKNSTIKAKGKITISPKITGFSFLDKNMLRLVNSEGETIFNYSVPLQTIKKSTIKSTQNKAPTTDFSINMVEEEKSIDNFLYENIGNEISEENLLAGVSGSGREVDDNMLYFGGLFLFLLVSAGGAYAIRSHGREPILKSAGSDFEIIDE